jgi:hypothetical protein
MGKEKADHKERVTNRREKLIDELMTGAMTENWAKSPNPVKRRIGRLEVGWREGIQWLAEDIRKMYLNFATISDAYDILDVNIAAIKSLCIDKGVFTEEQFTARRDDIMAYVDAERTRRQAEMEAIAAAAKAEAEKSPEEKVDADLVRMHDSAAATTDEDHIPKSATLY